MYGGLCASLLQIPAYLHTLIQTQYTGANCVSAAAGDVNLLSPHTRAIITTMLLGEVAAVWAK